MPSQRQIKIRIARIHHHEIDIPLPSYSTTGSSGMDIYASVQEDRVVKPGETVLIPTGFQMEIPSGYEAQIRPRSGLALKHGVGVLNSPGTIDSDYRGEVKIILKNFGKEEFTIRRGDRIAQLVICPVVRAEWEEVNIVEETSRGAGGFGHTGR
ncbi:MAG: dUTP diphosphatase [Ignavibacteriae bacterium]|nr:dUTP diphosphatase [Ignavibacteria bacterium]MBI3364146.1 dUTP diphosphatase [Ignavibacteriota bacterium]